MQYVRDCVADFCNLRLTELRLKPEGCNSGDGEINRCYEQTRSLVCEQELDKDIRGGFAHVHFLHHIVQQLGVTANKLECLIHNKGSAVKNMQMAIAVKYRGP